MSEGSRIDLSVIFPVHNEAEGITALLGFVHSLLREAHISFEILCVENGSTDDSYNILKKIEKKLTEVHVHRSEKGWGNAVLKGIENVKGVYTCYMVSDWQVDPKYILPLYKKIKKGKYDMVKIARKTRENTKRFLNSRVYNTFASLLFGINSFDINGTPKILKTDYLKKLRLSSENIALDLELLLHLKKEKKVWIEIPIFSKKRTSGASTTNIKSVLEMVYHMIRFRLSR